MSTEHIEALIYADIEKRKLKDIAVQLAIPLPTVKSRIQRARTKLRQVFFKCCVFEFDCRGHIIDYRSLPKESKKLNVPYLHENRYTLY